MTPEPSLTARAAETKGFAESFRRLQRERADALEKAIRDLEDVIDTLKGEAGRPESAELTLAWRKIQEAEHWIGDHLAQMPGLEE